QNQFLSRVNKDVYIRRSTRLLVLGKVKVISYKDLSEARAKCAAKEKAAEYKSKGKRGHKRWNPTPEVDKLELNSTN
ncbi:uncharacterized protein K441DRAFT_537610, partial [Cenococcum geophilum 1.58]|uniref:uncharacterized protein n=1 Tax=Cenococcum geophilum 1.58 TaxID=794803 RepID=UPI00358E5B34